MAPQQEIAAALQRATQVLRRRPEVGLHDDAPATARWEGGLRVVAQHANGTQIASDMPTELGGTGDRITPGWMLRAGMVSCAATSIAVAAAAEGITLDLLEVQAFSRSDMRGLLGVTDAAEAPVYAGPSDMRMQVRIAAAGVEPERLRALVREGCRRAPVSNAVTHANPLALDIEVADGTQA